MTPEAVIHDWRSLKLLDGPVCLACQLEMRWTRSTLVGVEAAEIIHVSTCPRCSMHTVRGKNFDPGQLCIASAISNGELNKIDVNQCTNERLWKLKLASKLLKGGDNDNWKPAPK